MLPADVEEDFDATLTPPQLTCANARLKASAVSSAHPNDLVIGADTLVYLDHQPFGKPNDLDDAVRMLGKLVGRTHQVCTGVVILRGQPELEEIFHETTHVTFRNLSENEIRAYLEKINPLDKAGSYAAQEHGSDIIAKTEGSWTNVVGLPMEALNAKLTELTLE